MTAELCDCFPTRRAGVLAVLDAVRQAMPDRSLAVWGVDGAFHTPEEIRDHPLLAAASNWLALARLAARLVPGEPAILIDIGTTTTDLIPIDRGGVASRGRSDTERLQTGELVYAGVRRTPIAALASELPVRGVPTGLAAEWFATTLDVYLILGDIAPDPLDRVTADGRPATPAAALDRLARMIGADRDSFTPEDARAFATAADRCLTDRLVRAAERACRATIDRPRGAIISGSGEFLAARVAARLLEAGRPIISLDRTWGPIASAAGCAVALVRLAEEGI
jgi:probable H4MPT-linked C1 transfer pathway protein